MHANLESPEFLINAKSLPDITSEEYDAFWENEDRKITEGVTINGFYFSFFCKCCKINDAVL